MREEAGQERVLARRGSELVEGDAAEREDRAVCPGAAGEVCGRRARVQAGGIGESRMRRRDEMQVVDDGLVSGQVGIRRSGSRTFLRVDGGVRVLVVVVVLVVSVVRDKSPRSSGGCDGARACEGDGPTERHGGEWCSEAGRHVPPAPEPSAIKVRRGTGSSRGRSKAMEIFIGRRLFSCIKYYPLSLRASSFPP